MPPPHYGEVGPPLGRRLTVTELYHWAIRSRNITETGILSDPSHVTGLQAHSTDRPSHRSGNGILGNSYETYPMVQ